MANNQEVDMEKIVRDQYETKLYDFTVDQFMQERKNPKNHIKHFSKDLFWFRFRTRWVSHRERSEEVHNERS